ncbi:hypothetical protein LguiA_015393 [Lonicera macranthoides]
MITLRENTYFQKMSFTFPLIKKVAGPKIKSVGSLKGNIENKKIVIINDILNVESGQLFWDIYKWNSGQLN